MTSLSKKELTYLQDTIGLEKNQVKFFQGCADTSADNQVKMLCEDMAKDHQQSIQILSKQINNASF